MAARPYPYAHDDCDSCAAADSAIVVHYDALPALDREQPLCCGCAGPVLAHLVGLGHVITVRALDTSASSAGTTGGDSTANMPDPAKVTHGAGSARGRDDVVPARRVGGVGWTVEMAEEILRLALPSGSVFLGALIGEGGTATVTRLRELTGEKNLHYMTLTLNTAARRVLGGRKDGTGDRLRVAIPRTDPTRPRPTTMHGYTLPEDLVPILDAALRRLGR